MKDRDRLLKNVEAHLVRFGISASRFGREAALDPLFVFDLRKGREPRQALHDRVERYMADVVLWEGDEDETWFANRDEEDAGRIYPPKVVSLADWAAGVEANILAPIRAEEAKPHPLLDEIFLAFHRAGQTPAAAWAEVEKILARHDFSRLFKKEAAGR